MKGKRSVHEISSKWHNYLFLLLSLSYPGEEGHILYSLLPPSHDSGILEEDEPYRGVLSRFLAGDWAPWIPFPFRISLTYGTERHTEAEIKKRLGFPTLVF